MEFLFYLVKQTIIRRYDVTIIVSLEVQPLEIGGDASRAGGCVIGIFPYSGILPEDHPDIKTTSIYFKTISFGS